MDAPFSVIVTFYASDLEDAQNVAQWLGKQLDDMDVSAPALVMPLVQAAEFDS